MVAANIIAQGEQADVLSGARRFNVDEYMAIAEAGILRKEDRVELMDGEIIVMAPFGDPHEYGTDWLPRLLLPPLLDRGDGAGARVGPAEYPQCAPTRHRRAAVAAAWPARTILPARHILRHRSLRQHAWPTTGARSWPGTPRPAYRRCGSPTCRAREVSVHSAPSGSGYTEVASAAPATASP